MQCIIYQILSSYTARFVVALSTAVVTVYQSGCRSYTRSTCRAHRVDKRETFYFNVLIITIRL